MRNYQKTSCRALTQQEPSLLTDRVFWISDGDRQRIAERQGANTPLPLEQSPPVSFKRLLGGRSRGSQSNRDRTDSHHNRHGRGQQDPEHSDPAHECHQSNEEEEARAIDEGMPRSKGSWLELRQALLERDLRLLHVVDLAHFLLIEHEGAHH